LLKIVKYPHPALRFESVPVLQIDDALRTAVRQMFDLMYEAKGIGLAANQVGLPFRFFVLNLTAEPAQKDDEQVFINPEIVKRHLGIEDEEGCLSLPGLYAKVHRAKKIRLKAFNIDGNPIEVDAENLFSRALQHETDHLSGRLFIDLLTPPNRKTADPKIQAFEMEYRRLQASGEIPDDAVIIEQLNDMARKNQLN
jgi:peptide deformylase